MIFCSFYYKGRAGIEFLDSEYLRKGKERGRSGKQKQFFFFLELIALCSTGHTSHYA